ncbi:Ankyrin repeat domain-containing protein, chloroplastic [Apostasia shenzhenica]|uniref:Ankyrin repeat domain-containing protein, chloroplastic n=1 Tax=Apostasia shenzhenica TaxID=1088818 RepID=A0A2H9ZWT8_9ASPA|nr:Ankyrin repeat domain-containing protein, chloroplastic [Apostasia shenzhenica]
MASLPPASSLRLPPSSFPQIPFSSSPYHPKARAIQSPPHPSTLSYSTSFPTVSAAADTSFPYSELQRRQYPKQEVSREERRGADLEERQQEEEDDFTLGDCLVFEDGAFEVENPFLPPDGGAAPEFRGRRRTKEHTAAAEKALSESLVPDKWREMVAQINLTKKEKRKIAHELRFGSRMEARRKSPLPDMEEYSAFRRMKLSELKPVVLDNPMGFPREEVSSKLSEKPPGGRVAPRNPRLGISRGSLDDITDFFNNGDYMPGEMNDNKKAKGHHRRFTKDEKSLLNKRVPKLAEATSRKWLPLHTLAASGEFYLLDMLLKHNVDINGADEDGLMAIHKAILSKKHAIINYLLKNCANPFIRDQDGATLIHYSVQTTSAQTIKILLLYNVDINLADNDGWTPLHLAVQTQRTDIVRLLLIKGADRTLKNQDGLTPLDLCLYCGHNMRTYQMIKLLKEFPTSRSEA